MRFVKYYTRNIDFVIFRVKMNVLLEAVEEEERIDRRIRNTDWETVRKLYFKYTF